MKSEPVFRHEERPHPGTRVLFTLGREGMAVEAFTSEVKTHEDLVYYDEVWDSSRTHALPRWPLAALAALTLAWAAALALSATPPLWSFGGGLLAAGWLFLLTRIRALTVRLFNYDGQELACMRGPAGPRFRSFMEALDARVAQGRYPLQSLFEGLPLGQFEWKGRGRSWSCRFAYDRLVFETRRLFGWEDRSYASLMAVEPPVRLAWKLPLPAAAGFLIAASSWALLAVLADGRPEAGLRPWAWASACAAGASALWAVLGLRVAVQARLGSEVVETPSLPWWQRAPRQELLKLLARLIGLADSLGELDHENYWEYHRSKLAILKEQGFLEPWPYRSALARLNSQEREDFGD